MKYTVVALIVIFLYSWAAHFVFDLDGDEISFQFVLFLLIGIALVCLALGILARLDDMED